MFRWRAVLALAGLSGLLGVIVVGYGSDDVSTAAGPPVVAPAVGSSSSTRIDR